MFTKPFYLGIPLGFIMSIDVKDKFCNVKYYLEGQKREIFGELRDLGAFEGKTDFGYFKLDMGKLRKLTFKDMPSFSKSKKPPSYDTIPVFTNGNRVPVADFRRFNTYCSSEGYVKGCGDRYKYFTDFRFLRGDSLQTVLFERIKTIEFNDSRFAGHLQGNVTVTLKNGKSANGELTYDVHDADVDGYTGIYEKRDFPFFIDPDHVQSIIFDLEQE